MQSIDNKSPYMPTGCGFNEAEKRERLQSLETRNIKPAVLKKASQIKPLAIDWLWPNFLPRNMLTVLAGKGGCGKSTLAFAIAATVSVGDPWPDGSRALAPSAVIIWSSEDAADTIIVPRLVAMGANLENIHILTAARDIYGHVRPFDAAIDMPQLEVAAQQLGNVALLIVDPILSVIKGDMHKANEVREGLQCLVDFAERVGAAVLGVTHFRKGTGSTGSTGNDPTERFLGSQAFTALARMTWVASKVETTTDQSMKPQQKRVLARSKSNISPDGGGYYFELFQTEVQKGVVAQGVRWLEPAKGTAFEILSQAEYQTSASNEQTELMNERCQLLRDELEQGEKTSQELEAFGKNIGLSSKQLRRVKEALGVRYRKSALHNCWICYLPKTEPQQEDPYYTEFHGIFPD